MTNKSYDTIVVGGGVVGAFSAFHLKALGAGSVLLIDAHDRAECHGLAFAVHITGWTARLPMR